MKLPLKVIAVVLLVAAIGAGGMRHFRMHEWMGMHGGMRGMMTEGHSAVPAAAPAAVGRFRCMPCHALHEGGVGPAFTWVAWRHRGEPGALEPLASFIEQGGNGSWGGTMPNQHVPTADAHDIARWIMALPPEPPPGRDTDR